MKSIPSTIWQASGWREHFDEILEFFISGICVSIASWCSYQNNTDIESRFRLTGNWWWIWNYTQGFPMGSPSKVVFVKFRFQSPIYMRTHRVFTLSTIILTFPRQFSISGRPLPHRHVYMCLKLTEGSQVRGNTGCEEHDGGGKDEFINKVLRACTWIGERGSRRGVAWRSF